MPTDARKDQHVNTPSSRNAVARSWAAEYLVFGLELSVAPLGDEVRIPGSCLGAVKRSGVKPHRGAQGHELAFHFSLSLNHEPENRTDKESYRPSQHQ
jgi:hypothetical protein